MAEVRCLASACTRPVWAMRGLSALTAAMEKRPSRPLASLHRRSCTVTSAGRTSASTTTLPSSRPPASPPPSALPSRSATSTPPKKTAPSPCPTPAPHRPGGTLAVLRRTGDAPAQGLRKGAWRCWGCPEIMPRLGGAAGSRLGGPGEPHECGRGRRCGSWTGAWWRDTVSVGEGVLRELDGPGGERTEGRL